MKILLPIFSAILFSLSTPLSKMILKNFNSTLMAGLCYISGALGLILYKFIVKNKEANISIKDSFNIIVIILSGGFLAPFFLFKSISITDANTISILLNFEMIFTSIIATLFFKEFTNLKFWFATFLIIIASSLISFNIENNLFFSKGSLYAILACLFWGIDNNFTSKISIKDPYSITIIKGLVGGEYKHFILLY